MGYTYHERERLCPEGVRVREIAHVHYACESHASARSSADGPRVIKSDRRVEKQTAASWQMKEEAHPLQLQPHA